MLIQIGRGKDVSRDDVTGALLACHGRIRAFTATGRRMLSSPAAPVELADAAARVDRYFRVAFPLHTEDEELSICPRLCAAPIPPDAREAIHAMMGEHGPIDALVASLLPRWATLARDPLELPAVAAQLARDTAELDRLFEEHLAREELVLFPAVRDFLAGEEVVIRAEMVARRARADSPPRESSSGQSR